MRSYCMHILDQWKSGKSAVSVCTCIALDIMRVTYCRERIFCKLNYPILQMLVMLWQ